MREKTKVLLIIGAIIVLTILFILLGGTSNESSKGKELEISQINRAMRYNVRTVQKNGYLLRSIEIDDYDRGFIECLNELTVPMDVSKRRFKELLYLMSKSGDYKIVVAYDPKEERVIGTGTLFVERKFIRGCAMKGHIEDIVVLKEKRGLGIGREIVVKLMDLSRVMGCYKTALVCDVKNIGFYEKCGLSEKEREMVKYN